MSFTEAKPLTFAGSIARPHVVIPVFPGTNCEYDTAHAFERAGAEAEVFVINNLTPAKVAESTAALAEAIRRSQIVMLPGGFSGGDEPGWLREVHHGILPRAAGDRSRARFAAESRRPYVGHLQRLPSAREAGLGALRRHR